MESLSALDQHAWHQLIRDVAKKIKSILRVQARPYRTRMEQAVALVLANRVEQRDAVWHVTDLENTAYTPQGHCTCAESLAVTDGLCHHRLAVAIMRGATERMRWMGKRPWTS